ncbi:hypothetical protein CIB48_g6659 [Xylaria polymorpha]|nr:hypothetical protein CIB48_g6659 [Xylaria polymorpha]
MARSPWVVLARLRSASRRVPRFIELWRGTRIKTTQASAAGKPRRALLITRQSVYIGDVFGSSTSQVAGRTTAQTSAMMGQDTTAPTIRGSTSDENISNIPLLRGLLSQLPLCAAGYHTETRSETVLGRVMSSYTSSVKALLHGHQLHLRESAEQASDHAMRETPNLSGNGSRLFAVKAGEIIKPLYPSFQLRPITQSLCMDDMLQELQACRIFHFAGYGHSDLAEPSRSCLLLED